MKRLLIFIGRLAAVAVLATVLAITLLQIGGVRTAVVNRVLERINPWPEGRLAVQGTSGNVISSLSLTGLTLSRPDGDVPLRIDTVSTSWRLLPALVGRVRIRDVRVSVPRLEARRDSTGSLDLLAPFLGGDTSAVDLRLDRLDVVGGHISVRDSSGIWSADSLTLRLRDLSTLPGLSVRIDSLGARVSDPVSDLSGMVVARLLLTPTALRIDTLRYSTSRSVLAAAGDLGGLTWPADSTRLRIGADPFHLDDIAPLIGGLVPGQVLALAADLRMVGARAEGSLRAAVGGGFVTLDYTGLVPAPADNSAQRGVSGTLQIADVDVSRILAGLPNSGPTRGEAEFDLEGPAWNALSGRVRATVSNALLEGTRLRGLNVRADWRDGLVSLDASARVNGGPLSLTGTIRPLDADFPANLKATLADWPIGVWTDEAVDGRVSAVVDLSGRLGRGTWEARARVLPSWVALCSVAGSATVNAAAGSLAITSALSVCDGNLEGSGQYRPGTGDWVLARLVLDGVSPALAMTDTTRSSVSGAVSGRGIGSVADMSTRMGRLAWGAWNVDSLEADLRWRGGPWTVGGRLYSGSGSADFDVAGDGAETRIERVHLSGLNLAYAAGIADLETSISGSLQGSIRQDESRLGFRLDPSVVNRQRFLAGEGDLVVLGDSLRTRGHIDPEGNGRILWVGHGDVAEGSFVVDSLGFDHLNVGALLPGMVDTDLSGSVTGRLASDRQDGHLVLEPTGSVSGIPLGGGMARFMVDADSIWARSELRFGEGTVGGWAALSRGTDRYVGELHIDRLDAVRIAALDSVGSTLSASVSLVGRGLDRATGQARMAVDSLRFSYGDLRVDSARGVVEWQNEVLSFREVAVFGAPATARFSGSVPVSADAPDQRYTLQGLISVDNIQPFAAILGAQIATAGGVASIRGSGRPGRFQVSVESGIDGIDLGNLHIASGNVLASALLGDRLRVQEAEVRVGGSTLSIPGTSAERISGLATLQSDSIRVEAALQISSGRDVSFTGGTNRNLDHALLETLTMNLDDAAWALQTPARFDLTDGVEIDGLVATADSQRIAIGGMLNSDEGDDLFLSAENVRLGAVADMLGFDGLDAVVNATISAISGARDAAPSISGTLDGSLSNRGREAGRVAARIALIDERLSIDASMTHASGRETVVRGFLPLTLGTSDLSSRPVSLRFQADGFPVDWTLPFFDPALVDQLQGRLSGDVLVRGTYAEPQLSGVASLTGGRIGLPDLGKPRKSLVYDRASVHLTFRDDGIRVDSASVRSGPGTATARGMIEMRDLSIGEIDLAVVARDFLAVESEAYRTILGANMRLAGTTRRPRLGGDIRIEQGDFFLTDETSAEAFEPVELSREDLLALEERFGIRVTEADTTTFDFYEALTIQDLRVDLARNTWLRSARNPSMDIQFAGSMDVSKLPHSDLQVFGSIEVIPDRSRINQFGRRFEIEQGTLTFSGPADEPDMDLGAVYHVRSRGTTDSEVTIRLEASGRPDNLTVTFQSDPAMELADIVSYIATGRPASESLQFGGTSSEDYLRSAAGLAIGPITSLVENLAGAGLGLDVVEIEQDETSGLRLTAGKYVSPRFFVSVSQPIALSGSGTAGQSEATEVAMEYEFVRNFLLSLLSRGAVLEVNLRWEQSF